jgi:hypothetical protein
MAENHQLVRAHQQRPEGPEAPSFRALVPLAMLVAALSAGCDGRDRAEVEDGTSVDEVTAEGAEHALVEAAVQGVFDAINNADPDVLRAVMMPEARVVAVRPGQSPATSSVEEMASLVADPPQRFVERMWNPEVEIQGPLASVWAPYDFYRDGEFSHCGVDAFHLIQVDGTWRIESLVYNTLQPPDCAMHPNGPPEA